MGKKKTTKTTKTKDEKLSLRYPMVSVCTPTFNRRPFIENMFECFRNQDYPKSRMEWIIVDDGNDKIEDLVNAANIPQIKYFKYDEKMSLGKKRNLMHSKTSGAYIVYMDDDDYYPRDRVSHAVDTLKQHPRAMCAGSSIIHVHFKHINKIVEFGPYGPNHSTAGTFAFRRALLDETRYDDDAALAEEKAFLKNYTVPFVQLNPKQTILVFSHNQNTFDKRTLLENPNPKVTKYTDYEVDYFVKEESIRKFFMEDIDGLLDGYEAGNVKYKPDVIEGIATIQKKRDIMQKQQVDAINIQNKRLLITDNNTKQQREATLGEVSHLFEQQQTLVTTLRSEINDLKKTQNKRVMITDNDSGQQREASVQELVVLLQNANSEIKELRSKNTTLTQTSSNVCVVKSNDTTE
jgi:glycosyltransferase involved in cell wall biosynthesis|uniref:Glycosyltransferase 2-like domain-containing protein n=1 Tax=viral metagenome TaxID=1070528 RepID=A0A6C0JCU0_9ZZZZ